MDGWRPTASAGWYTGRVRRLVARPSIAILLVAVLAAGCSDGGDGGSAATTTAAATTTGPLAPGDLPADPSGGCGTDADVARIDPDQRPGDVEQLTTSGGLERLYRLGVPASYDPDVPAPLVLNLHGSGSNALQASVYGDVPRAAAERGMVTVAPEAVGGQWELSAEGDDAEFLDALVDDVEGRYCIDRNREFIVGMSLGAWKAAATACGSGDRYAAVSLVTVEVFPGTCDPLPVLAFHGRADLTVPYGEGGEVDRSKTRLSNLPGAVENIEAWADNGGCDPEPEVSQLGDDVELRRFVDCDPGIDVALYSVDGGGHTWPGSDIDLGPASWTTDTIDATELTLDFLEEHPRNAR